MSIRYRFDPENSRFTVQAFGGGLLSFMAHSPTFAVRHFAGELRWQPNAAAESSLVLNVRADSLDQLDQVSPTDRAEIERRMHQEVLESAAYPEIRFEGMEITAAPIAPERFRLQIAGQLFLRGVTHPHTLASELNLYSDGVRLGGSFPLRLSDYQISPVTALAGMIRLKDQLKVAFDLVAWRETP